MSITLPPDTSADSYCDVAAADAYHVTRLNSTLWTDADVADKESALKTATRRLESENWKGNKADEIAENSLRWPRALIYNADNQLVSSTSVPLAIQHATAELALELIKAAADELSTTTSAPTSEVVVGPIKLKLDTARSVDGSSIVELSGDVDALIAPYKISAVMGQLVRS